MDGGAQVYEASCGVGRGEMEESLPGELARWGDAGQDRWWGRAGQGRGMEHNKKCTYTTNAGQLLMDAMQGPQLSPIYTMLLNNLILHDEIPNGMTLGRCMSRAVADLRVIYPHEGMKFAYIQTGLESGYCAGVDTPQVYVDHLWGGPHFYLTS